MNRQYNRDGGFEFVFKSPGPNAYRIRLIRLDGDDGVDFVMAGPRKTVSQKLYPGDYRIIIIDLAAISSQKIGRVKLSPNMGEIDLGAINDEESSGENHKASQSLMEMGQFHVQSRRNSILHNSYGAASSKSTRAFLRAAKSTAPRALKEISNSQGVHDLITEKGMEVSRGQDAAPLTLSGKRKGDEGNSAESADEISLRSFTVGLSKATPPGGWVPADNAKIEIESGEYDDLWFNISQIDHDYDSRYRFTITIQSLPAIRVPVPAFIGGTRIGIFPVMKQGVLDLTVALGANNAHLEALLSALSRLDKDEAQVILEWVGSEIGSVRPLFEQKNSNPWAATLAAILFAKSGEITKYISWAYNLARLAPHISDASIIAAWACAVDEKYSSAEVLEAKSLQFLIDARKIGAPNFVQTNSMALDLLDSLAATAVKASVRSNARAEMRRRARRSRYRVFNSPVFMWEEKDHRLRSGILPRNRYRILKAGMLKGTKWS